MGRQNPVSNIRRFRLTLVEDETHKSLIALRFSKPWFIVAASAAVVIVLLVVYCLIAFTPLRTTIPGYPDAHSKKVALANAIKIDSLERSITRWELYAENLSRVLTGEQTVKYDSIIRGNALDILSAKSREELAREDSLLRERMHEQAQFELSGGGTRNLPIEGMHFFTPIKGVISKGFDMVLHPGLDILAPKNTVVSSIYDGTVIFSGWDDEIGNVIIVQHPNGVISMYQHCEKLLRKVGDAVKAGTPIALVGSTGMLTKEEYLHFALWYNGEAVNPTKHIKF